MTTRARIVVSPHDVATQPAGTKALITSVIFIAKIKPANVKTRRMSDESVVK